MTRLLVIEGSPRGERSRSAMVADAFLAALAKAHPTLETETLNVWDADLPPFDGAVIEGRYKLLAGDADVGADQEAGWAKVRAVARHFLAFDAWLFAVPMWNYGLPYRLKHYIDLLTHPGLAFNFTPEGGVEGLYAGKRACVICSSALSYDAGTAMAAMDHQEAYMRTWLGFCGLTDATFIRAAPMFGPPELVEPALEAAKEEARAAAATFF